MPDAEDEKQWLDWQRADVVRDLKERGYDHDAANEFMHPDRVPDEVFQIIRANAVNELAECYITGLRRTIRIREALKYSKDMRPADTERAAEFRRQRNEALTRLSGRATESTVEVWEETPNHADRSRDA
jgi:hypothetical protein